MSRRPVDIPRVDFEGAKELSAPELNKVRFSVKHTVITPGMLRPKGPADRPGEVSAKSGS